MDDTLELYIKYSYSYFSQHPVNSEKINAFIDNMSNMDKNYPINRIELFKILETRHSITISDDLRFIQDTRNHIEWFNPYTSKIKDRNLEWNFWDHYKHRHQLIRRL